MSNKRQKSDTLGAPFASRFKHDLERALDKSRGEAFMAHHLCTGIAPVRELFGEDFLALMPPGKEPCIKYFIFGHCYSGGSNCNKCHSLSAEPSKSMLDGLVRRVKACVDAFVPKA
jgi:hypothetical protein